MSTIRRQILTNEHESLLLCMSAFDLGERFGQFADMSGVPDDAILSSALCAVPIPDYRKIETGRRRWAGTNPVFMWHPLMWLPERLAQRRQVTAANGRVLDEIDQVYVIRVAVELAAAGLYDTETGTWADVLSVVDLDIADPAVQQRVAAWLEGAPDPDLDSIDLSLALEDGESPDWAFDYAVEIVLPAMYASWAVFANDMHEILETAAEADDQTAASAVRTVYYTSVDVLADVPGTDTPHSRAFWANLYRQIESLPPHLLREQTLPEVRDFLADVRDRYWADFESLPSIVMGVKSTLVEEKPEPAAAPAVAAVEAPAPPTFDAPAPQAPFAAPAPTFEVPEPPAFEVPEPPVFEAPKSPFAS